VSVVIVPSVIWSGERSICFRFGAANFNISSLQGVGG